MEKSVMKALGRRKVANAKPCPICGKTDITVTTGRWFSEICKKYGGAMVTVECSDCYLSLPVYWNRTEGDDKDYRAMSRKAISMWNNRVGVEA